VLARDRLTNGSGRAFVGGWRMVVLGEILCVEGINGWMVVEDVGYGNDKLRTLVQGSMKKRDAIRYANRLIKTFGEECPT